MTGEETGQHRTAQESRAEHTYTNIISFACHPPLGKNNEPEKNLSRVRTRPVSVKVYD